MIVENHVINFKKVLSGFILLLFLGGASLCFLLKHRADPLAGMDLDEKHQLELLFSNLFLRYHFGYTLLGDKPVSTAGHFKVIPMGNLYSGSYTYNLEWNTWEKYKDKFKFKNYLLTQFPDYIDENLRSINLVNKKAFLNVVDKNLDLFREKLGASLTPQNLLEQIEKSSKDLFEILGKDEALYGIVLGYGRENSLRFKRYFEIYSPLRCVERRAFSLKWPRVNEEFASFEEELEVLCKKLQGEASRGILNPVEPVHFGGDPDDQETKELRRKYQLLRKEITKFYSEGNILEKTIRVLVRE